MPLSRQRHDGMHETHASSHCQTSGSASQPRRSGHTNPKSKRQHRRCPTRYARRAAITMSAATVLYCAAAPARHSSKSKAPANKTVAQPASAKKASGVWGWSKGDQTYLRSRPGALTAPVAKVGKHTKMFVWGKFDGWYRVETPDHVFGWVYHSYINSPDLPKIPQLSHFKAKLASDRTSNQTMYGSTELLKRQYVRYGAPGAARTLKQQGVLVAALPSPKTRVKAAKTPRIASRPATRPAKAMAAAPATKPTGRYARMDTDHMNTRRTPVMPRVEMNEVGAARFTPALTPDLGGPLMTAKTPVGSPLGGPAIAPTPDQAHSAAPAVSPEPVIPDRAPSLDPKHSLAPATAPEQAPAVAVPPVAVRLPAPRASRTAIHPAPSTVHKATKAQPGKPAKAPAKVAKAPAKPTWAMRRLAAAQRRAQIKAQRREQLRVRMGSPASMVPPTVAPGLTPISPEELLKARDAYLATQAKTPGAQPDAATSAGPTTPADATGAAITPSALQSNEGAAKPLAPASPAPKTKTPVRVAAAPFRGGSPRDRYKAMARPGMGDALANEALTYRGMPYVGGASSPNRGFDCSGLVYFLLRRRGYNPPRTASGYGSYGTPVSKDKLQPGDILLFANTYKRGISHVGIYMGNGKFVHAANGGRGVTTDALDSSYYGHHYYGARRVK